MGITLRYVLILLPIVVGAVVFAMTVQPDPAPPPDAPAKTPEAASAKSDASAPVTRVAVKPPPEIAFDEEERAFEERLEEIGSGFGGTVGIAVVDVETGRVYEYNGTELLPQQSVSKLWVALAALGQVDGGSFDLNEKVTIRREDLVLFYQPIRDIVRSRGSFATDFRDLMERALARSDNAANDRLLRRVGGPDAVQNWIDDRNLNGVRFGTDERAKQSKIAGLQWRQDYSYGNAFYEARDNVPTEKRRKAFETYLDDPIDGATPIGIAKALAALARGELLSEPSTRLIREILSTTKSGPRRIKGGAPSGWSVDHKTGTGQFFGGEQSGYNDVGIITAPDGSEYAIAVMIGRTRESTPSRMAMMQSVTRATADFHDTREAGEE